MPTDTDEQVEAAARELLDRGVDTVLVKLGSKGSLLVTRELMISYRPAMHRFEHVHSLQRHTSICSTSVSTVSGNSRFRSYNGLQGMGRSRSRSSQPARWSTPLVLAIASQQRLQWPARRGRMCSLRCALPLSLLASVSQAAAQCRACRGAPTSILYLQSNNRCMPVDVQAHMITAMQTLKLACLLCEMCQTMLSYK
jgi:hypothetical protein